MYKCLIINLLWNTYFIKLKKKKQKLYKLIYLWIFVNLRKEKIIKKNLYIKILIKLYKIFYIWNKRNEHYSKQWIVSEKYKKMLYIKDEGYKWYYYYDDWLYFERYSKRNKNNIKKCILHLIEKKI